MVLLRHTLTNCYIITLSVALFVLAIPASRLFPKPRRYVMATDHFLRWRRSYGMNYTTGYKTKNRLTSWFNLHVREL